MDLTKVEDINKRWQEYTEELYKKDLNDPDNHYGMITHLEPDILECEVKWALGSITTNKASGGDGIPVELFQILKDDAVKFCCTQYASKFGKLSSGYSTRKVSFHYNPKERQCQIMLKLPHIARISHTSKVMLKILLARLQQYVNHELSDVQANLEKAEEPEIKLPTSIGLLKKQESSPQNLFLLY